MPIENSVSYRKQLAQLKQAIRRDRIASRQYQHLHPLSFGYLASLLRGRLDYLVWSFALVLVQLIELLILAFAHSIYFPPLTLWILRLLSTSSLTGLLCALLIRNTLRQQQETLETSKLAQLTVVLGQRLFKWGMLLSILLVSYLIIFSPIHFSAPPIYRAVILSGAATLPFDILTTVLLYNSRLLKLGQIKFPLRAISLSSFILAIAALAADQPLLYLCASLAPRIIGPAYLINWISGGSYKSIFSSSIPTTITDGGVVSQIIKSLNTKFAFCFCAVLALELPLFVIFGEISRLDSNFGLMLYFMHKMMHLSVVLSLKNAVRLSSQYQRAIILKFPSAIRRINVKSIVASVFYAGLAALLLPLLLIKEEVLFWSSPVGNTPEFNVELLLLTVILQVCYSVAMVYLLWHSMGSPRFIRALFALAASVFLSTATLYLTKDLILSISLLDSFLALGLLNLVILMIAASSLGLFGKPSRSCLQSLVPPDKNRLSLFDFFKNLEEGCRRSRMEGMAYLAIIKTWPGSLDTHPIEIKSNSRENWLYCRFGANACILSAITGSKAEMDSAKLQFLTLYGVNIEKLWSTDLQVSSSALQDHKHPALQLLYSIAGSLPSAASLIYSIAGNRSPKFDADFGSMERAPEAFAKLLRQPRGSSCFEILDNAIAVLRFDGGWKLDSIPDLSLRRQFEDYLLKLNSSNEFLSPAIWSLHRFKGFFHLNQKGMITKACYVLEAARKDAEAYRQPAFLSNFSDALNCLVAEPAISTLSSQGQPPIEFQNYG